MADLGFLGFIFVTFGIVLSLLIVGIMIFCFVFWIAMMISAIKNKAIKPRSRYVWFGLMLGLSIIFSGAGLIVAIVYYFTDHKKHRGKSK